MIHDLYSPYNREVDLRPFHHHRLAPSVRLPSWRLSWKDPFIDKIVYLVETERHTPSENVEISDCDGAEKLLFLFYRSFSLFFFFFGGRVYLGHLAWHGCGRCMPCVQQELRSISDALRFGELMVGTRRASPHRAKGLEAYSMPLV